MQSIDLIRDNSKKSAERVLARVEEMREPLPLHYVADHWYMHRGHLADARRASGIERMWV
jgi:hypothetical protein